MQIVMGEAAAHEISSALQAAPGLGRPDCYRGFPQPSPRIL
jgi:hypothetical protein